MPGGPHPPLDVIESWPAGNYDNPERQGPALKIMTITLCVVGLLVVSARAYTRIWITRAFGWDDGLAILSMGCTTALSVLIVEAYDHICLGCRIWDFPITLAAKSRHNLWISEWCYLFASGLIKISVLLFYKRLSAPFTRFFWYATWAGIWYNVANILTFSLCLMLLCRPTSAYWNQFSVEWIIGENKFTCADEGKSLPASGAFSLFGDVYSTLLPIILLWNLHMRSSQKTTLYVLFGLGFFVLVTGGVRIYYLNHTINGTYDILWSLYNMWIWTLLELYAALIAASAPALKQFLSISIVDPIKSKYGSASDSRVENAPTAGESRRKHTAALHYVKAKLLDSTDLSTGPTDLETGNSGGTVLELTSRSSMGMLPGHRAMTETTAAVRSDDVKDNQQNNGHNPSISALPSNTNRPRTSVISDNLCRSKYTGRAETSALPKGMGHKGTLGEEKAATSNDITRKRSIGLNSHPPEAATRHTRLDRKRWSEMVEDGSQVPRRDPSDDSRIYHKVVNNIDLSSTSSADGDAVVEYLVEQPTDFVHNTHRNSRASIPWRF